MDSCTCTNCKRAGDYSKVISDQIDSQIRLLALAENLESENAELRKQNAAMAAYLRTHDHRLHDEAMKAAREQKGT